MASLRYWRMNTWYRTCRFISHARSFYFLDFTMPSPWASSQISTNHGLRMRRECRERFPCHRPQRKPLVSDPDMHHGTCVTHMPWCMSGSLTCVDGENVPGIPSTCATQNFTYLVGCPLHGLAQGGSKVSLNQAVWSRWQIYISLTFCG